MTPPSDFVPAGFREWVFRPFISNLATPWENVYIESFNGKYRNEFLNREIFYTLKEAKVLIEMAHGIRHVQNVNVAHPVLAYLRKSLPSLMYSLIDYFYKI